MRLIKVERLNSKSSEKKRRPLWLVWVGEQFLDLKDIWTQYARRFRVDHWYRFAKQRLHWTLPSLSTAKQCERSSVSGYTIVPAQGAGGHGKRMGDMAGYNTNIEVKAIVDREVSDRLLEELQTFPQNHALIAYRHEVEGLFD